MAASFSPTFARVIFAVASIITSAQAASISSTTQQVVRGIGASGAWWVNDLALFPASVRQNVSDLLFNSTSGIGITDYRYNLGGGGVGVNNTGRKVETPYISDGVYNFSADPAGTFYLKEAARYQVPVITLFVNSAPTTFTNNNQSCGCTLIDSRIPQYAQFLADVVSYWRTQGVNITHVSPMNEPDNSFSGCDQEGMSVNVLTRGVLLQAVASALSNAGLTTKVIGDETSTTWEFYPEAPLWLNSNVGSALDGIAHHQYAFVDGSLQAAMTLEARSLGGGTPTWSTEICCYKELLGFDANNPLSIVVWGSKYDPTMVSGLRMALLIYQALSQAQDEHWDWWTALSNQLGSCAPASNTTCAGAVNYDGWDDGLIYYDPNFATTKNFNIYVTKRFAVLKHFAQAAPLGATVRTISTGSTGSEASWRALAFDYPADTPFALVAFNAGSSASAITITGVQSAPKSAFRTSAGEDYAVTTAPVLGADGSLVIEAPALSIYTLFF